MSSGHVLNAQSLAVHPSSHAHVAKFGSLASDARHEPWPEHSASFADGQIPRFSNATPYDIALWRSGLCTAAFHTPARNCDAHRSIAYGSPWRSSVTLNV